MNAFAHFRATIDGCGVHFIHERGKGPSSLPLVVTHGWPGSFAEMLKLIPLLTDPAAHGGSGTDAFDVVVPSLPGYGFSDRPAAPGVTTTRIAELWARLMTEVLGYSRFGAHGGDIGAGVSRVLGLDYAERTVGVHVTYPTGAAILPPDLAAERPFSDAERAFLEAARAWSEEEGAYSQLHRTKPQTLAYALNDSPVGLASWIVEKFRAWSDCGGDLERSFTKDELLTSVTLYWVTQTIGPSMRLYYETRRAPRRLRPGERIEVPCAVALFPKEISRPPREYVERTHNVVRWTEMPRGGHFPALEEPELLAEDIRAFFRPLR